MRKYILLSIMTVVFVSFQNCAKQNVSDPASNSKLADDSLGNLSPAEASNVSFANSFDGIAFTSAKPIIPDVDVYKYDVDVNTGVIRALDIDENQIGGKLYCLQDSELAELKTILDTARLCVPEQVDLEGVACAMVYKSAYADLVFNNQGAVSLGESTSSCSRGADLCGEHASLLKTFVQSVLVNIKSKECTFETQ